MVTLRHRFAPLAVLLLAFTPTSRAAQFNRDEAAVRPYTEPDVLRDRTGVEVRSAHAWVSKRRPQVLRLLSSEMFGFAPARKLTLEVVSKEVATAFNGTATREQITLRPTASGGDLALHILIYTPRAKRGPMPVFLGLNYAGNQSVTSDPGVHLGVVWVPDAGNRLHMHPEKATASMRGSAASEWPIETILQSGFGFATLYDGDVEPDFAGGEAYGFRSLPALKEARTPAAERWGGLAVWAWGLSRALDYLKTDVRVDGSRVAVIGHSRLGKAALWAGATDQRFAMVISNESGKGGAALMKRNFGETVDHLNTRFPYWFNGAFKKYSNAESDMPFDSHFLLALIAPRPLYVASAAGDYTLDAKGEYTATRLATPVYRLFGSKETLDAGMPSLESSVEGPVGYHIRPGKHDMTTYDWDQYLKFARKYLASSQH